MDKSRRAAIKRKAYEATKEFFLIALYLWVILGLFAVYRSVILTQGMSMLEKGFVVINALVLGKVMLIAKELRLGEIAHDAPLIYPTLLKSALFSVVLALFKILEEAARGLFHGRSFQQSIADIGGGTWQGILCVAGLLFVLLIPFFAFTELQRVLGDGKLQELFFRTRQPSNQPSNH
jgi:hypothetical protein